MNRFALAVGLLFAGGMALAAASGTRAADLARQVKELRLDREQCFRVRDLTLVKEDARFYLTDGYLMFSAPVQGLPLAAVFTTDVEAGDGEVLLMPPNRSERMSLAAFTQSPNLSEHFRTLLMVFTDRTVETLLEQINANPTFSRSAEMANVLGDRWDPVLRNFCSSFEVRLVRDLLSGQRSEMGFFYSAIVGKRLGNFDIFLDPRASDQMTIGQVTTRQERAFFDSWAVFDARSWRTGRRKPAAPEYQLGDIRIDAAVQPDLELHCVWRAGLTPKELREEALSFEITRQMRITEALIDGAPAEVFQRESMRANLIRGSENDQFLVVPAQPLEGGRTHTVEIRHEGNVIRAAGNDVYFIGSRGSWYPQRGLQFAKFDLTFRYPRELNLVSTGRVVEERTEGEVRVTRHAVDTPIRFAGFNLGKYERAVVQRGRFRVEAYANRSLEAALQPRPPELIFVPPLPPQPSSGRSGRRTDVVAIPVPSNMPDPTAGLRRLATEIASALEFMSGYFGPPPLDTLTVSPIPGTFGQGFPGLLYLSTLAYLDPKVRPASTRDEFQQMFYSEILHAHETAHQWWGNIVTSAGYQHDWLMEALANYSALAMLERKNGVKAMDSVLDEYRKRLLQPNHEGREIDAAGPITWGTRLESSQFPLAWRIIVYEKGSWIIHMLRRQLGDERFFKMLGEATRRFRFQQINTEQFRTLAKEFLPPQAPDPELESFFDHWVYGTGIPALKLEHSLKGRAPRLQLTLTVRQSQVAEDFAVDVPVEVQFGGKVKPQVYWVRTGTDAGSLTADLKQAPAKVTLDPGRAVLAR